LSLVAAGLEQAASDPATVSAAKVVSAIFMGSWGTGVSFRGGGKVWR